MKKIFFENEKLNYNNNINTNKFRYVLDKYVVTQKNPINKNNLKNKNFKNKNKKEEEKSRNNCIKEKEKIKTHKSQKSSGLNKYEFIFVILFAKLIKFWLIIFS